MIYVKLEKLKTYYKAVLIHYQPFNSKYGLNKTEQELLQDGILVPSLPEKKQPKDGYLMELRATLKDKELYYEEIEFLNY